MSLKIAEFPFQIVWNATFSKVPHQFALLDEGAWMKATGFTGARDKPRTLWLAGAASDGEGEAGGRVEHQDPDLEAAINSVPPIPASAGKLSKSGWITHDTLKIWVGQKPKAFRTPVSGHPRCLIRTTWLFRDGSWSKAEDKVDMRVVGNKTAKLDSPAIISITIFERPGKMTPKRSLTVTETIVPLKSEVVVLSL